jgi:hypothetical protein
MAPFGQPEQNPMALDTVAGSSSSSSKPAVAFGRLTREPTLSRRALTAHDSANGSSNSSNSGTCEVLAVGVMRALHARSLGS